MVTFLSILSFTFCMSSAIFIVLWRKAIFDVQFYKDSHIVTAERSNEIRNQLIEVREKEMIALRKLSQLEESIGSDRFNRETAHIK